MSAEPPPRTAGDEEGAPGADVAPLGRCACGAAYVTVDDGLRTCPQGHVEPTLSAEQAAAVLGVPLDVLHALERLRRQQPAEPGDAALLAAHSGP
jgi:hypothetical protein